ncbi:MAG: hypothetical protein QM786_04905 [Breznakibacter sp.]
MRKYTAIILWVFGLLVTDLNAQIPSQFNVDPARTFAMFRDPSYITFAGGVGNIERLVFEADIIPYYQVSLSNTDDWGVELSPQVILRMYNQESYPVRTPSFMPRATFFYHLRKASHRTYDLFGYMSWCHHSNGQENSFYMPDSVTVNTTSGNFSTNMVELGMFLSKPDRRNPFATNYSKLSAVYHYYHNEELDNRYGDLRFYLDMQTTVDVTNTLRYFGRTQRALPPKSSVLQLSTKLGWIAGAMGNVQSFGIDRLIAKVTVSYKPSFFKDVTFFSQYYYGQDYYNIHFGRTLHLLRFGLMARPNFFY